MSQTPPPFTPSAPPARRKTNTPLILLIIFVAFALVCVVPGFFIFRAMSSGFSQILPTVECAMAFDDVRKAILEYADAHEGLLPNAETWQDDVRPYYKKIIAKEDSERGPFTPMDPDMIWGCRAGEGKRTGMAFNEALSGKKLTDIKDPYETPLIFEVETAASNAHEEFRKLDPEKAPTVFGERRDWMVMNVKGEANFDMGRRSSRIRIDTGSDSAEPPKPK